MLIEIVPLSIKYIPHNAASLISSYRESISYPLLVETAVLTVPVKKDLKDRTFE
tara:strand:+ start:210 stop:371 length:162 start_codon:yes stop_codon:yes gene_type:complete